MKHMLLSLISRDLSMITAFVRVETRIQFIHNGIINQCLIRFEYS